MRGSRELARFEVDASISKAAQSTLPDFPSSRDSVTPHHVPSLPARRKSILTASPLRNRVTTSLDAAIFEYMGVESSITVARWDARHVNEAN
jgi:hypothetical protein